MNYSISEIHKAIEFITPYLQSHKVVLFDGPMGAGKTTLISALCKSLGSTDELSSPTFSIVNEYQSNVGVIYHFDFYRIKSIDEAFDFGLEEYLYSGNYCFLEWSEKVEALLPDSPLKISIEIIDQETRHLIIS